MRAILDIELTLGEIISATEAFDKKKDKSKIIKAITTDTREMEKGDLFIAIPGTNYDGESFCRHAKNMGCEFISAKDKNGLLVKNTKKALLSISGLYKSKLANIKHTVAITGSVGKSTTKEMLGAMLRGKRAHITNKNYNNYIGLSHTILTAPRDTEYLVAELGTNHMGEISEMSIALNPNVAIITKIGTSHIGNFGSREMIAAAKLEIQDGLKKNGTLLIPEGEPLLPHKCGSKTVSIDYEYADYSLTELETSNMRSELKFTEKDKASAIGERRIYGRGNLQSLAFASAAMRESGFSVKDVVERFSFVSNKNTRQNVCTWQNKIVINDSYNASFESIINSFEFMGYYPGRRCAVLGDVLELGRKTEKIHYNIGVEAKKHGIELLFLFGVYAPFIAQGAIAAGIPQEKIFVQTDTTKTDLIIDIIKSNTASYDVILFKASHGCGFSKLCQKLIAEDVSDVR